MYKRIAFCLLVLVMLGNAFAQQPGKKQKPARVLLVSSLHGYHKVNENFTYDHLYNMVETFKPDVVAVEVRNIDVKEPQEYIRKNYPLEMAELLARHTDKKRYGFDWLGEELEGKLIPDGYFKTAPVLQLERAYAADSAYKLQQELMQVVLKQQQEMLSGITAAQLVDGRYDATVDILNALREKMLENTPYAAIAPFHAARDRQIAANIATIIRENPGKRIVVVMGANHHGPTLRHLQQSFGKDLLLEPVK